jgi:hypothetical protein
MRFFPLSSMGFVGLAVIALSASCGGGSGNTGFPDVDSGGGSGGGGSGSGGGSGGSGSGSSSGTLLGDDSGDEGGGGDPSTCAGAAALNSYIGCDYWPTVTANNVWSIFDYAVAVANAGTQTATITVTGPGNTNQTATVAPSSLVKIYLPWVSVLKGVDADNCGTSVPLSQSVLARGAAYHLVSSVPVTVYQFNALEYQPKGGPTGKDWTSCPGNTVCANQMSPSYGQAVGCFSFTNDASLLLPSTAMTGNYRVAGHQGWGSAALGGDISASYMAITATADGTTVNVNVSTTGHIVAGGGIADTPAGGMLSLAMNHGDVVELVGDPTDTSDLSGSLVTATNPVQVITGHPCIYVPDTAPACDHLEGVNFPAETLGKDYVVTQPTGPSGAAVGHLVRIYGNFDNTTLTYSSQPSGCPTTINAGQVVECGIVTEDFEVKGNNSFAVGTFQQGGSVVDSTNGRGDPSESFIVAVPQYRTQYVFLAPDDYEVSYVVIVTTTGAVVTLDGTTVTQTATPLGATGLSVLRLTLGTGQAGAHVLTSTQPVGIQVMGYGSYTSYQYPGGLDLQHISPPPTAQ